MGMIFCHGCAKQIHETAPSCPHCGALQSVDAKPQQNLLIGSLKREMPMDTLNKKFHMMLIVAASVGVLLLYTTHASMLISVATGVSFGLCVRLFVAHKKSNFFRTKKLDWMLLTGFSAVAFGLMLARIYNIQGLLMVFLAVRSLVVYFKIYSNKPAIDEAPNAS